MTRKLKVPTYTFLVFEELKRADDLLTAAMIASRISVDIKHTVVALHNLKYQKAVQLVEGVDALWWFATPEDDVRIRHLQERAPEDKPRAKRRKKYRG